MHFRNIIPILLFSVYEVSQPKRRSCLPLSLPVSHTGSSPQTMRFNSHFPCNTVIPRRYSQKFIPINNPPHTNNRMILSAKLWGAHSRNVKGWVFQMGHLEVLNNQTSRLNSGKKAWHGKSCLLSLRHDILGDFYPPARYRFPYPMWSLGKELSEGLIFTERVDFLNIIFHYIIISG